jgi:hypothetical protein
VPIYCMGAVIGKEETMPASSCIGIPASEVESVREILRTSHLDAVRNILTNEVVKRACREAGMKFRERVVTPVLTVLHMVAAAIWPDGTFQAAWGVFGSDPVPSGTLAKARKRLPETVMRKLSGVVSCAAARASAPWALWHGYRVLNLDGTCVSMPDEPSLKSEFGVPNTKHGPGRYPVARMVVAIIAGTMAVLAYTFGGYAMSEDALAALLLPAFSAGDLLVGDRRFSAANKYVEWGRRSVEFVTRLHQRVRVDRLERLSGSASDFVTKLMVSPKHRRADPTLPKLVTVRLIAVAIASRGSRGTLWLATSLLDDRAYPAEEVAKLYSARWRIETVFQELKVVAAADVLRSKSPAAVRKELAARVMAVNLVRIVMMEAAAAHGRDPVRLSFTGALRCIVAASIRMSVAPPNKLLALYAIMLEDIAEGRVPLRLGRDEPRALRREWKHYPHLRVSRREWRLRNAG